MELAIEKRAREDGAVELLLAGELNVYTYPRLREVVLEAAQAEAPAVVVDLAAVEYLDSCGLGVLIGAQKTLTERGAALRLVNLNWRVAEVMRITGMALIFTIEPPILIGPPRAAAA